MFALAVALTATILLTPSALAQIEGMQYTVWSSVVFQRTGERTPDVITYEPTILTTAGAQQAYTAGSFFRNRYINAQNANVRNGTVGAGNEGAPLFGLNTNVLDLYEVNADALDLQWNVATAYAFMQGLYPPWTPNAGAGGSTFVPESSMTANGTIIDAPLGGYQYPQVHVRSAFDPNFIYLSANFDCPNYATAALEYDTTTQFSVTQEQFNGIYDAIGSAVLIGVIPEGTWEYNNAYAIYDYLSYEYAHNETVKTILDRYKDVDTNTSYLTILRWLADEQQYAQLGNLSAWNPVTKSDTLPNDGVGSISTIAGNYFAYKVLDSLQTAIEYQGQVNKLNLMFADYHPLTSFFSLMGMGHLNSNFYGTAEYGSSVAFELYSYVNTSSTEVSFPDESDLWVQFFFRNGTDSADEFRSYSLFNRGPSLNEMMWSDFKYEMENIMLGDVSVWCDQCSAPNYFCAALNESSDSASSSSGSAQSGSGSHQLAPAVAGVIGAIIALAIASLIFGAVMLFGGIRFHRNANSKRNSDLGGFKGGQKMRSDQDLTIPKGGAGASVVQQEGPMSPVAGGHERVGSWELKQAEADRNLDVGERGMDVRPSFESEMVRDPFADGDGKPVVPHERV